MLTGIFRIFAFRCVYLVFIIMIIGCTNSDLENETAAATSVTAIATVGEDEPVSNQPVIGEALVDSAEIQLDSATPPLTALVVARGTLPDGCTRISGVRQQMIGNAVNITITTISEGDVCTQALVEFEERIPVDLSDLAPGTYSVSVNGTIQSFELADNVTPPTVEPTDVPEPTPAPTLDSAESGTITGLVFHDLCAIAGGEGGAPAVPSDGCMQRDDGSLSANGVFNNEEPPLAGVQVSLGEGNCDAPTNVQIAITDDAGQFSFADVPGGYNCLYVEAATEPNASQLIPGRWTTLSDDGKREIIVDGDAAVDPIGWDYQFLPVPTVQQTTDPNRAACIDLFAFDGDVTIQDDAPFEPGEPVVKIWRLINTGSCNWNNGYSLTFLRGDQMGAPASVPIDRVVEPGGVIDVRVDMVAPNEMGTYRGDWIMRSDFDQIFGVGGNVEEPIWLQIKVVEPDTVGGITGVIWSDSCDQSAYTFGDPTLPEGCLQNANGTIRGDGVYDREKEAPIGNVTILLGNGACGESEQFRYYISNDDGTYAFPNLLEGTYCVFIEVLDPVNYPVLIPGNFTVPQPGRSGITVTLAPNAEFENINFAWDFLED